MEVRKAALIAGTAGSSSLLTPGWYAIQQFASIDSIHRQWWSIPLMVATGLFTPILPVFCFVLHRNEGALRFPTHFRALGLAAAVVYGLMVTLGLPRLIGSLGPGEATAVLTNERGPWIISDVSTLLRLFSDLAYILLIVTFFRVSDQEDARTFVSKRLRLVSMAATIMWGLWSAFNLVRLALIPYFYSRIRDYAAEFQRQPPEFRDIVADALRSLLLALCLLAAPFMVWRSSSADTEAYVAEPGDALD